MPRWSSASSESRRARAWKASKSVRASHGGSIAGLNACTNGCMSVEDRSCFSYQVAAGSTTSESSVVDVIRKSALTSRSSFPSGGSSCQATLEGRGVSGFSPPSPSVPRRLEWVPRRFFRKYSLPLALEPKRLERHSTSVRGHDSGASTSAMAGLRSPRSSASATYAAGVAASPASTAAVAASATSIGFWSNCG